MAGQTELPAVGQTDRQLRALPQHTQDVQAEETSSRFWVILAPREEAGCTWVSCLPAALENVLQCLKSHQKWSKSRRW